MPDYFSHLIAAEKIYQKLDGESRAKITSYTQYLLGAQGGDVFFAYNIKPSQKNLGRLLHKQDAKTFFEALRQGAPSYAAGFATHYALDCTLHPAVYAYESRCRTPFAHLKFEADLGLYISRYYGIRRSILPRERVLACTSAVYDTVKLLEPSVTVTGVERCLKRHFSMSRYLFKHKRQEYKCDFDFPSLCGALEEAVDLGVRAVQCVLEGHIDGEIFARDFLQH